MSSEYVPWWEPRRDGEATAVYLARVLDELGADEMAGRARLCHFDDYFCPDEVDDGANINRLVAELADWKRSATRDQRLRAHAVTEEAKAGEFDGTREESNRWAASKNGREVFRELVGDLTGDEPADDDKGQLWVRSEVMPDGTYGVGLNVGADRAWAFDREAAVAYAVACFARATEAEHDAAVFGLLTTSMKVPEHAAAKLVCDLRADRPDDHKATDPLRFTVAIGRRGPFLKMELDGTQVGELTPADLRDHAVGVLNVLAAADLDANLQRVLVGVVGIDDNRARQFVGSLQEHWPSEQRPRRSGHGRPVK
ncbi:MAG: hypothetical protein ACRDQU_12420 [Pseudonocardiaceae bacterium]